MVVTSTVVVMVITVGQSDAMVGRASVSVAVTVVMLEESAPWWRAPYLCARRSMTRC